jgi:hypothetical protein
LILSNCIKVQKGINDEAPVHKFKQANSLANELFKKLDSFFTGTNTIPICAISTQLEHAKPNGS